MGQDKLGNDGEEEFSPKGPRVSWKAMLSFSSSSMIQLSSSGKLEAIRKGGWVRDQGGVPVPFPLRASFSVPTGLGLQVLPTATLASAPAVGRSLGQPP